MLDASMNYSIYKKDPQKNKIGYDVNNVGFKNLVQAVALGSKAVFRYTPSKDEIIKYYAKKHEKSEKSVHFENIPDEEIAEANQALQAAEELQPLQNRKTEGDASEAGLIKFVEPIVGLERER